MAIEDKDKLLGIVRTAFLVNMALVLARQVLPHLVDAAEGSRLIGQHKVEESDWLV